MTIPAVESLAYELTEPEIRFFRSAGYVRSRGLLDKDRVSRLRCLVGREFEDKIAPYRVNQTGAICRIDRVIDRDPLFMDTLRLAPVLDPLLSLLGPNVELLRFRHNHATLNLAGDIPFRLHRDILQWTRGIVTVFIYLEDAGIENGCTHVVPGTQYLPFAGMPPDGGGGNWADDHDEYRFVSAQALPVPMRAGGVLFIDSLAFHSVGVNSTGSSRMSLTFAFQSVDELTRVHGDERVLVAGERMYMGSDRKVVSGLLRLGDLDGVASPPRS